jgi:hypothetical protein
MHWRAHACAQLPGAHHRGLASSLATIETACGVRTQHAPPPTLDPPRPPPDPRPTPPQGVPTPEGVGIIPRAVDLILARVEELAAQEWEYTLEASFIEVYNNTLRWGARGLGAAPAWALLRGPSRAGACGLAWRWGGRPARAPAARP